MKTTSVWHLDEQERRDYEKEYWRHPRVRTCPGCEEAVMDEKDADAQCDIHGEPYEGPFEWEERFYELFGHSPWEDPAEPSKIPHNHGD